MKRCGSDGKASIAGRHTWVARREAAQNKFTRRGARAPPVVVVGERLVLGYTHAAGHMDWGGAHWLPVEVAQLLLSTRRWIGPDCWV
jgi:hypothetical protein